MVLYNVAEVELSYKPHELITARPVIQNSEEAYELLYSQWDQNKIDFIEQAKVLLLNQAMRVLGIYNVSSGGISETSFDPRLVFVSALKANASHIILAHNHPSGNLKPSEADTVTTRRMIDAGKLLCINVRDHIIVTSVGYHSFADGISYYRVPRNGQVYYEAVPPF